jgi:putative membrane protein
MTITHRLALASMLAGAAAFAQTGSTATSTPSSTEATHAATKMSPSGVLTLLHQVNQDEIHLGKMAQTKAQNDKVKDFAKTMVDDHTALDKKLTDFVRTEGKGKVTISSSKLPAAKLHEMQATGAKLKQKLSAATGATFDREYMSAMLKGHEGVLTDLDAALPSLTAQQKVHDLVSDARDKVKEHRDHASDILKDLEGSSAVGGSGMQGTGATPGTQQSVGGGAPGATTGTRAPAGSTTAPSTGSTTSPSTTPSTSGGSGR